MEFKNEIEEEIDLVLKLNQTSYSEIFNIKHIKQAIRNSNKSSGPYPDHIAVELIENGGEQLFYCLTYLKQASFFLGVLPKTLEKANNRIYLKKQDK